MNKEIAMIIDIPFNTPTNPFWPGFEHASEYDNSRKNSQTKKWIDYRIDIFMKYTALSLINQTNQNFKCVVRYTKETENLILDALSKYKKLPDNIIFTSDGDKYIEDAIADYKYIYHIRIDSDNMFSKDFIENLYQVEYYEGLECILAQNGYMYDAVNNILATIFHGSPSFYALIYTVDDFLGGFRHNTQPDHWGAVKLVHEKIESPSYLIVVHEENLSNNFEVILDFPCEVVLVFPCIEASVVSSDERDKVLKSFNLIS